MSANPIQSITPTGNLTLNDHASAVSEVLFLSIGEGAIVIDERGNISRVNQVALDILGYKAEDLMGKWYPEAIIAEDEAGKVIPNMDRPVTQVFFSGKPLFKKLIYRRKDGTKVPVALTVSPVMLDDKPLGAIQLFRDITEEARLEHAKDEFISIASHQLRTPATVVKQYLGMVLEGYIESEAMRLEMLKTAYDHNNNQLEIIDDLLKVAQIEANKLTTNYQETDLVGLTKKIISGQQPDFEKRNITLLFTTGARTAKACVDPLHIQMVLENLINNANKYSYPNSTVNVELVSAPKTVKVHVTDQGIGIGQKDIAKLFNKFSRVANTNSTADGTGLGLYWAKKLVEMYGGEIHVTSKLNRGSTFSVYIPRKQQS